MFQFLCPQRVVCFFRCVCHCHSCCGLLKDHFYSGRNPCGICYHDKTAPALSSCCAPSWALHSCLGNWNGRFHPRRNEYWHLFNITTERNPADHGTSAAVTLKSINWFTGPSFLLKHPQVHISQTYVFELLHPDMDAEVHPWNSNL